MWASMGQDSPIKRLLAISIKPGADEIFRIGNGQLAS